MAKIPCAKCGSCTSVCPVYQVTGKESLTARGRLHLLEKLADDPPSDAYIDIFSRCLLCNACKTGCPRGIDLPSMVVESRSDFPTLSGKGSFKKYLAKKTLAHGKLLKTIATLLKLSSPILENLPQTSGLRLKLGILASNSPEPAVSPLPPEESAAEGNDEIMLFKGCLATHIYPQISTATEKLVSAKSGQAISSPEQACCGLASYSSGDIETAKELAIKNISAFDNNSRILTPCASCYSHLAAYPELLKDDPEWNEKAQHFASRLEELSSFLSVDSASISEKKSGRKIRVLYHDPCHLRFRTGDFSSPPRQLLSSLPDIELVELPRGPRCCGLGGLFNLAHPDLSNTIGSQLIDELKEISPEIIISTCSGCLLQLKFLIASEKNMNIEVRHLSEFMSQQNQRIEPG